MLLLSSFQGLWWWQDLVMCAVVVQSVQCVGKLSSACIFLDRTGFTLFCYQCTSTESVHGVQWMNTSEGFWLHRHQLRLWLMLLLASWLVISSPLSLTVTLTRFSFSAILSFALILPFEDTILEISNFGLKDKDLLLFWQWGFPKFFPSIAWTCFWQSSWVHLWVTCHQHVLTVAHTHLVCIPYIQQSYRLNTLHSPSKG